MDLNKKRKMTETDETLGRFEEFITEEILSEYSDKKFACVRGQFKHRDGAAVIILEKTPFTEADFNHILNEETGVVKTLDNDVYKNYNMYPDIKYNGMFVTHRSMLHVMMYNHNVASQFYD